MIRLFGAPEVPGKPRFLRQAKPRPQLNRAYLYQSEYDKMRSMKRYVYYFWCSKHDHDFYGVFSETLKDFDSEFIVRLNGPYCDYNNKFVCKSNDVKILPDGKEVHSKVFKIKVAGPIRV